jgi:hypothetical protein
MAAGAFGIGAPRPAAAILGVVLAAAVAGLVSRPLFLATGFAFSTRRWIGIAALLGTVGAVAQLGPLSLFMIDAQRVERSMQPSDPFRTRHSCMSSYAEGARFASAGSVNIYDLALYQPRHIGPLQVDPYHYPPPFLLLPQALRVVSPEFGAFRALWFALQLLLVIGAFVAAAIWIRGVAGATVLAGGALVLAMPAVLFALQQGNFQVSAPPLAALSFALLLSGRLRSGAAILAWTAVAKIFPGILVVHLVAARRWRALAWVAAGGVVLLVLTVLVQGTRPFHDFVTHAVPSISDGTAFPHTERPPVAPSNWTVYGLTVRIRNLGASWLTQPVGLSIASIYGVLIIAVAAFAGWRRPLRIDTGSGRLIVLQVAVALVGLASFRSPFAGAQYGSFSTLCLLALLAAGTASYRDARLWLLALVLYGVIVWSIPSPANAPTTMWLLVSGGLLLATVALNLWVAVRASRSSGSLPEDAAEVATYMVPGPGAHAASAAPL